MDIFGVGCRFLLSTFMEMEKLTYLVNWGKNRETAWSGTNYSLYKALSNHYDIKDINLKGNRWMIAFLHKVLQIDVMSIEYYWRHFLSTQLKEIDGKVFQFSEVLSDNDNRKTYMYLDNSVSYVNYLRKERPDIFAVSAFQKTNSKIFEKREKEQDEYMRSCSGLFTMGHWLREWLINRGFPSERIHAVGGGTNVDTKLINPLPKSHNKILFVGKDFKRKGGFITYEAFKLLREKINNAELYVIGPKKNPIEKPIEGFHFIGQIPFREEAKYYNMCDIFCMPSYFEAYGLVFVEALTFGLPCIGRNCYEMPYFIQDGNSPKHSDDATGLLLNHDDPKELASLMLRLLNEESFSRNVIARRQQYINDYSWDTVAGRIAKIVG